MKLRHLVVSHFRGIGRLNWSVAGDLACLIGPGDACKSTILDAIELALSPRTNVTFDDGDFHAADTTQPIVIEATVGDLPSAMLSDAWLGLSLRGYSSDGRIVDEPGDDDERVLSIRLSVDASLEPEWVLFSDRDPVGQHVAGKTRQRMAAVRLGAVVDWHLSWTRGSVLSRLTGEVDEHASLLADASRLARRSIDASRLEKLTAGATRAQQAAEKFGVKTRAGLQPHLDTRAVSIGLGGLALHDGEVPARRSGLGSRRLLALAMQREVMDAGGVALIDEIEHGLEPFRLRRLMAALKESVSSRGTTIVTSHSAVAVGELEAKDIRVVRRDGDDVSVLTPASAIQGVLRTNAEAFLARRVIVCEGRTELALCRGLDAAWSRAGAPPLALAGIALADGGGSSKVGGCAQAFASLRYSVAVLADADRPLDVDPAVLRAAGVEVIIWDEGLCIEQRVFRDLPWPGVVDAVAVAVERLGDVFVRAQVAGELSRAPADLPSNVEDWRSLGEAAVRDALGRAAKSKNDWFKQVGWGQRLGEVVAAHLHAAAGSDLAIKIELLRTWTAS